MAKNGTWLWFARGGGIGRMGPYPSYEQASFALMSTEGVPIEGAFVWAEPKGYKPPKARSKGPRLSDLGRVILNNWRR